MKFGYATARSSQHGSKHKAGQNSARQHGLFTSMYFKPRRVKFEYYRRGLRRELPKINAHRIPQKWKRSKKRGSFTKSKVGMNVNHILQTSRYHAAQLFSHVTKGALKRLSLNNETIFSLPRLPPKIRVEVKRVMGFSKSITRVPVRAPLEEIKCKTHSHMHGMYIDFGFTNICEPSL